jgi:hypothetical protein
MDPNKSSSASPSAVPSPSTDPPPSDASPLTFIDQEFDGALEYLPGGGPSESWKLMEAILLFELAGNDAGSYDTVVQEGERALLIENRTDPGDEDSVPAWRIEELRKEVLEIIEKSKRQIIVLGGGNRRDKWKRLLEDNSLAEVKAEFEATLQRKMRIPGRKPLDFKSPSPDDRFKIKKHKKVESNDVATISRVRAFWNDGMSVESKSKLLRIGIEDLKAYLDKNKLRMAMEVLTQAIDYAKAKKTWKFWVCCRCGERVSESDSDDHLWDHLATLSSGFLSHSPDEPPEWAVKMVENGVWKPVESICAAGIMERRSAAADWPYVDDIERAEIIERIHKKLQLFTSNKCLAWSHLNWLQYLIVELLQNHIPKPVITDLWLHHTLHLIRFLEVPGLNRVLEFLEDLASVCALGCLGVLLSEDDVRGNQWFWDNARERVVFSSDFSALLFDDRLLRGETVEPDIGVAVVTSSTIDEDCDADSDALVYWLWTEGPTIVEQIKAWTSLTEACKCQGMEFYNIIEAESLRLQRIRERKCEYLRYQKPLANVDSICVEENWKREQISGYHPQGYVSLFFKRWKELEAEGDAETGSSSSCELDIIWSIMKESQSQSEIQMVILKQKDRLAREVGVPILDGKSLSSHFCLSLIHS